MSLIPKPSTPVVKSPGNAEMEIPSKLPGKLRAAGTIWIVFGGLILLLLSCVIVSPQDRKQIRADHLTILLPCCVGGVISIWVGFRCAQGTAKGVLGYGIVSIILSVPLVWCGIPLSLIAVSDSDILGRDIGPISLLAAGILFPAGMALLVAGILAIRGRNQYKAWRGTRAGVNDPARTIF